MRIFAQRPTAAQQTAPAKSATAHQSPKGSQTVQRLTAKDHFRNPSGFDFSYIPTVSLQSGIRKAEGKPGGGTEKTIDGGASPKGVDAGTVTDAGLGALGGTPLGAKPAAAPAGPLWKTGSHVAPTFKVTETEKPRSNSDPATTDVDTPTFTGGVAKDAATSTWRYQLKSVKGTGRINFIYYTKDHYPAPTPNNDSGDLSNVTKANWSDIVSDLETHKNGVAGNWSAYRRTILHERYHWNTESKNSVKAELVKAENGLEHEGVGFAAAPDAAAAEKALAPKAKKVLDDSMTAARAAYNALGDSAGDPPYVAGSRGAVDLAARVKTHATKKKW